MRLCLGFAAVFALAGCPAGGGPDVLEFDLQQLDATDDQPEPTGAPFCATGETVAGAVVPSGFCIRRFAMIGAPRVLEFAPNGDLFVAAPSFPTPGGAAPGPGQIVVYSDDDRDLTPTASVFLADVGDVHGVTLSGGFLYFTREDGVFRVPYQVGDRRATAMPTRVAAYERGTAMRWTHALAHTPSGVIFTGQGTYTSTVCPDTPRTGAISRVDPMAGTMALVSHGYRNPLYMRCHFRDENCLVAELGDDGGPSFGAREKIIHLRPNTQYGYPCCATTGQATPHNSGGRFDCATCNREEAQFPLNDTPFGLDWERGRWPAPFRDAVFVALHGSFYSSPSWAGARIVFATADPQTRAPTGSWNDFVRGFGPGGSPLDRPADVAFSRDGRLFFADDAGGAIYWVAPETLRRP